MPPDGATKGALEAVNALRHRYGAKPLKWDDQLYHDAHAWAQQLAQKDDGLHHAENVCENLAISLAADRMYDYALVDAVRQWWAATTENNWQGEEWIYFNKPDAPYEDWGHFANLVGKDQEKMGIAAKRAKSGWYVVLRMYGDFNLSHKQYSVMPAE